MKINNKILVIFFSFIMLIILCNFNTTYAYSAKSETGVTFTYPDEIVYYMEDNYEEYWEDTNISWCCWKSGSTYFLQGLHYNGYNIFCYNRDVPVLGANDRVIIEHMIDFNSDFEVTNAKFNTYVEFNGWSTTRLYTPMEKDVMYFKNVNIYVDTQGKDFFLKAPPTTKTITVVLTQEIRRAKIMETIKTMITGFLKYLIVFVISVIAFWKGWQFLLRHFKRA